MRKGATGLLAGLMLLLSGASFSFSAEKTICEIQQYNPGTGLSPLTDSTVTVTGVVTVPPGIFLKDWSSMFIIGIGGDDCGINVFTFAQVDGVDLGDTIKVRGLVEEYISSTSGRGATTEISFDDPDTAIVEIRKLGPGAPLPEPEDMSTGWAGREENEGKLVRVQGKVASQVRGQSFTVDDGTGEIEIYDFGENFPQDSVWLDLSFGDEVTVVGIISQSDANRPYLSDYSIHPRANTPDSLYQDIQPPPCIPDTLTPWAVLEVSKNIFCPEAREKITIMYSCPHTWRITLRIFDVYGRCVATLDDRPVLCGQREFQWDGRNELMEALPIGLYHLVVTATDPQRGTERQATAPVIIGRRLK